MSKLIPILLALMAASSTEQTNFAPRPAAFHLTAVSPAPGIDVLIAPDDAEDGNILVACTPQGRILIDSGLRRHQEEVRKAMSALRCQSSGVRYVVNSHWHIDHTGGNAYWAGQGAVLIASRATLEFMSQAQRLLGSEIQPAPPDALPEIVFDTSLEIHAANVTVELLSLPAAHTRGNLLAWFPRQKVLYLGDLYYGRVFPWVDRDHGGSVIGLGQALESILAYPPDTVFVPGHGRPVSRAALQELAQLLKETIALVEGARAQNRTLANVQREGLPAKWHDWAWVGLTQDAWLAMVYEEFAAQHS